MGTSTSFPLASCVGITPPGICSVKKEAGKQGTNVVVKGKREELGLNRLPPLPNLLPASGVRWALLRFHRRCTKETLDLALVLHVI